MDDEKIPMVNYWKGQPINEEMSKQQLIEIIDFFGRDIQRMREDHKQTLDFLSLVNKRRG